MPAFSYVSPDGSVTYLRGRKGDKGDPGVSVVSLENPDHLPVATVLYSDGSQSHLGFPSPRIEHDWVAPYSYVGRAVSTAAETDQTWRITRIELLPSGDVSVAIATNVAWADRGAVTYG